ncbi:hypothetical protein TNCV_3457271 [Trichonephila clavipes]|nr:hypothetical protein TNCV_3457271 [Trichonephila clavipes]
MLLAGQSCHIFVQVIVVLMSIHDRLDTLRENCGIILKQASTDGGVLWKVVRVNVVQVREKGQIPEWDPRETRSPC